MILTLDSLFTLHITSLWDFTKWILDMEDRTIALFSPIATGMISPPNFYNGVTWDLGIFRFFQIKQIV